MKSFGVAGDREGQHSKGIRWPYGPTGLVTPFNFPLEILGLQSMGSLMAGNKLMMKGDLRVSLVTQQLVSDLLECGLDPMSLELAHADKDNSGLLMQELSDVLRVVQFTGSSRVAEILLKTYNGKVKIEDR